MNQTPSMGTSHSNMVNNEIITADKANMMSSNIDIIEMKYYLNQTKYILYDLVYEIAHSVQSGCLDCTI